MRIAVYVALVALALAAAATGELTIALAIGGVKAALVGAEFMELRHAARAHGLAYAAAIAVLVLGLVALSAGA